ncbi:MAG: hypothetical protein KY443_09990 [Actinobacteria bacterium]|nr:hypothetical protein [Actinomycetota bacterium]
MNPRLLPQSPAPSPAKGSAPRLLRTLGLGSFLSLSALLLWGDAAHADEPLAPVGASRSTAARVLAKAVPVDRAVAPMPDRVDAQVPPVVRRVRAVRVSSAPPVRQWTAAKSAALTMQSHSSPAVHQCNADTYPTGAGWEATCRVTVENTLGGDGSTSSRVTTTWCLAAAGVLPPQGCTTDVTTSNSLVSSVDQCNGILAGGSNMTCSVDIVNNVPVGTPTTGVTVNQCVGSGQGGVSPGGPPTDCDPVAASTTGATVTQCNGSANGGGGPERVQCSVTGSTTALPVTVNQCNGSTAGGSTVTCDVTYTNNFVAATGPGGIPGSTPRAPGGTGSTPRSPGSLGSTPSGPVTSETGRFTSASTSSD